MGRGKVLTQCSEDSDACTYALANWRHVICARDRVVASLARDKEIGWLGSNNFPVHLGETGCGTGIDSVKSLNCAVCYSGSV